MGHLEQTEDILRQMYSADPLNRGHKVSQMQTKRSKLQGINRSTHSEIMIVKSGSTFVNALSWDFPGLRPEEWLVVIILRFSCLQCNHWLNKYLSLSSAFQALYRPRKVMSVSLQFGSIVKSWNPTCSCLEDKAEWLLLLDLLDLQSQPLTVQSQWY